MVHSGGLGWEACPRGPVPIPKVWTMEQQFDLSAKIFLTHGVLLPISTPSKSVLHTTSEFPLKKYTFDHVISIWKTFLGFPPADKLITWSPSNS